MWRTAGSAMDARTTRTHPDMTGNHKRPDRHTAPPRRKFAYSAECLRYDVLSNPLTHAVTIGILTVALCQFHAVDTWSIVMAETNNPRPWEADPQAAFARRLGKPATELDPSRSEGKLGSPDMWELTNGDVAAIGRDLTDAYASRLPEG